MDESWADDAICRRSSRPTTNPRRRPALSNDQAKRAACPSPLASSARHPGQLRGNQTHRDGPRFGTVRRAAKSPGARLAQFHRDRSGQLLIPRSKVRILHGPCREAAANCFSCRSRLAGTSPSSPRRDALHVGSSRRRSFNQRSSKRTSIRRRSSRLEGTRQ